MYRDSAQQKQGPVSYSKIQSLFQAGTLNGQSLGWRQGMTEWRPLAEIPALKSVFPAVEAKGNRRCTGWFLAAIKSVLLYNYFYFFCSTGSVTEDGADLDLEQPDFDYGDVDDATLISQRHAAAAHGNKKRQGPAVSGAGPTKGILWFFFIGLFCFVLSTFFFSSWKYLVGRQSQGGHRGRL
jgi:hypothetical protein